MSGDAIGTAIAIGATVIMYAAVFTKIGPFAKVYAGLETIWRALRAGLHDLAHRETGAPVIQRKRTYLTADEVEELEIECYVGPYAEPFRAESLKAYRAKKNPKTGVREVPSCERGDPYHRFAANGLCVRCGISRNSVEAARADQEIPEDWPLEYLKTQLISFGEATILAREKLGTNTLADCLMNPNRDVHHWRTFQGLEGFHTKCLRCGVRQERTQITS